MKGGFKLLFHFFMVWKKWPANVETGPQPFITSYSSQLLRKCALNFLDILYEPTGGSPGSSTDEVQTVVVGWQTCASGHCRLVADWWQTRQQG